MVLYIEKGWTYPITSLYTCCPQDTIDYWPGYVGYLWLLDYRSVMNLNRKYQHKITTAVYHTSYTEIGIPYTFRWNEIRFRKWSKRPLTGWIMDDLNIYNTLGRDAHYSLCLKATRSQGVQGENTKPNISLSPGMQS